MTVKPSLEEAVSSLLSSNPRSTKCGELACQHDSFQSELDTATIVAFAPYYSDIISDNDTGGGVKNQKKKTNENQSSALDETKVIPNTRTYYAIILSDSIFFPEVCNMALYTRSV